VESIHGKFLLHQKERWKTMPHLRLLTNQQMDKEKSKHISTDPTDYQQA
jgi:hypothetical protein